MELHHVQVRNGVIVQDSSEDILATPTLSSEFDAFTAGASSSAPPVPVAQASTPRGDDPDDSGDDEDNNEEEEEEEKENNDNIKDANNEQEGNFVGLQPVTEHYTSMFETGHFPNLLQDVLHELGTYDQPLYDTR
jgi:ribosomal protein L12E/L44/L45/RPP1/RPP2